MLEYLGTKFNFLKNKTKHFLQKIALFKKICLKLKLEYYKIK